MGFSKFLNRFETSLKSTISEKSVSDFTKYLLFTKIQDKLASASVLLLAKLRHTHKSI
jgi:hypothetical protein